MTDIVERLRDEATDLKNNGMLEFLDSCADEIERLRERIAELESQKTHLPILGKVDSNGVVHWRNP